MPSYLGEYKGAATNRVEKLHRAINSFLLQQVGELIIVADGCDTTINEVKKYTNSSIKLISIEKQELFSGVVRQTGIDIASYDWICYLDSDDEFKPNHLQTILNNIDNQHDWMYYDFIINNRYRHSAVKMAQIGTANIIHKKSLNVTWPSGYGHDWFFIEKLGHNYKKISGTGYIVHHIPGILDT